MGCGISKSRYMAFRQCPKRLWLEVNHPELAVTEEVDAARQAEGDRIGDMAMSWFGDYTEVRFAPGELGRMVDETARLMESGCETICEASFAAGGGFCSADILHRLEDGTWQAVEVKSSSKVKPHQVEDLRFQCEVMAAAGVELSKAGILHVDSGYVRGGELDLHGLLALDDLTALVLPASGKIENEALELNRKGAPEPEAGPGRHCDDPVACPFKAHCWAHIPVQSVFGLSGMSKAKAWGLAEKGAVSYESLATSPDFAKLNPRQRMQVESALGQAVDVRVDAGKVRGFLEGLSYPLHLLDFETFQPAVPLFEGTRPYQQIPSQFSLHVLDGRVAPEDRGKRAARHLEFLGREGTDPRRELTEALCSAIPMGAMSMAYNMSFERTVIKQLAESFPNMAGHLESIRDNMVDLMAPFQKGWAYLEAMHGSYSIKKVLPACFPDDPELDYHRLNGVHNGSEAMAAFKDLANHAPEEIAAIRESLLRYCELDTWAMVRILWWLEDHAA